jgi:hypothetical protein
MASEQDINDFIGSTFRSIWSLELMIYLSNHADRSWSRAELVEELRASELIVSQSLDALIAAGLVSVDADGCAKYAPASARIAAIADATKDRYRRSPNAVRRLILTSVTDGLTAFADAFKFRKD